MTHLLSPLDFARSVQTPCLNLPNALKQLTFAKCDDCISSMLEALSGSFPVHVRNSVPKRQYEYGLGRLAASALLAELGVAGGERWIGTKKRRPTWPDGIVGSISHTNTLLTICAGYRSESVHSVGIDIEELSQSADAMRALDMCFFDDEIRMVSTIEHGRVIGFAAKEALFKCLNPVTDSFFDFREAKLLWIDEREGTLMLQLQTTLSSFFPKGTRLSGSYRFLDGHVYAAVCWADIMSTPAMLRLSL